MGYILMHSVDKDGCLPNPIDNYLTVNGELYPAACGGVFEVPNGDCKIDLNCSDGNVISLDRSFYEDTCLALYFTVDTNKCITKVDQIFVPAEKMDNEIRENLQWGINAYNEFCREISILLDEQHGQTEKTSSEAVPSASSSSSASSGGSCLLWFFGGAIGIFGISRIFGLYAGFSFDEILAGIITAAIGAVMIYFGIRKR